ncbi:MAG TPA: DUF6701 domain-containing protein, partial [Burkholderiales bacterium]|nr:DUF6701 domain-containing protein [Burkholderiales bacterium]
SLSAFAAGVASTAASWSEVGLINLFAISTSYLGSGQNVRNSVLAGYAGVGRFYPDHFFVATSPAPVLTNRSTASPACSPVSSFTYMDEPFSVVFTLQARNTSGIVTQNYGSANTFARLTPATAAQLGFGAVSGTTNLSSPRMSAATTGTFISGQANISATLAIARQAAPDGPFTAGIGIAPVDADNVALRSTDLDLDVATPVGADHRLLASTDIRFGRMRLQNALGSALLDLPISLTTQYYNGSGFVTNSADSCTRLQRSDIRFDFVTSAPRLAACETVTSPAAGVTFAGGVATLRLTKPTSQHEGVVDLSVNLNGTGGNTCTTAGAAFPTATSATLPWLRGNWNGSTYTDNPRGRHTFGLYKAADQFIYLQENY